ncbi:hypothetical protein F3Y22_tig00110209pilonHSYRG00148 [Hibiscus syriacus]|uniref:KIB1-4 beta-propeller domain-containing protein n=1 Tax=Hibiscus syriacus TaxID=106335 RepID=A0A6A3BBQ1_HIBSY|nr:hypothetical protein F3Y22_tig00110209pilonHSYRG00148 [Hibiscus syriacus]
MRDSFVKKIVLSANPSEELRFVAVAILNRTGELAYCRNGDDSWRFIPGENSSLSLSATDFTGYMGNCIYFTDDYSESNYDGAFGEHDIGIYKLWDRSIEPLPCYPRNSVFTLRCPTLLWVTPSPC